MNPFLSIRATLVDQRRAFIRLALKRATPGSGSAISFLHERTARMRIVDLRSILSGVRWALVGGIATRTYMPERSTLDVDILIHADDAVKTTAALTKACFIYQQQLFIPGSSWKGPDGSSLDVLERTDEWVIEALKNTQVDPQGLPVLSLPYLVLMKLQSSRAQDLADVSRMLGAAHESSLDDVRGVVAKYQSDAVTDLEGLIQLGKLEQGRREK